MIVEVKKIKAAPDQTLPFSFEMDLSDLTHFETRPFQNPIRVSGKVRAHLGMIELTARIQTELFVPCSRCLEGIRREICMDVSYVLSPAQTEEEGEFLPLEGDAIDLASILYPDALLQLEPSYLCRSDCRGLCPGCGTNRNQEPCTCDEAPVDDRLKILETLLNKP